MNSKSQQAHKLLFFLLYYIWEILWQTKVYRKYDVVGSRQVLCFQIVAFTHKSPWQLFPHDSNSALCALLQKKKKKKGKASAAAKWTTVCEAQREGSDKVREEARCQVGSCLLDECSSKMTCQGLTPHVQFIPLLSHNTLHTATHYKN